MCRGGDGWTRCPQSGGPGIFQNARPRCRCGNGSVSSCPCGKNVHPMRPRLLLRRQAIEIDSIRDRVQTANCPVLDSWPSTKYDHSACAPRDTPPGPALLTHYLNRLYIRHFELIDHFVELLHKHERTERNRSILFLSKWLVSKRPRLAGFQRPLRLHLLPTSSSCSFCLWRQ